jgi:hypothetical protein
VCLFKIKTKWKSSTISIFYFVNLKTLGSHFIVRKKGMNKNEKTSLVLWIPQAKTTYKNRNAAQALIGISTGTL